MPRAQPRLCDGDLGNTFGCLQCSTKIITVKIITQCAFDYSDCETGTANCPRPHTTTIQNAVHVFQLRLQHMQWMHDTKCLSINFYSRSPIFQLLPMHAKYLRHEIYLMSLSMNFNQNQSRIGRVIIHACSAGATAPSFARFACQRCIPKEIYVFANRRRDCIKLVMDCEHIKGLTTHQNGFACTGRLVQEVGDLGKSQRRSFVH